MNSIERVRIRELFRALLLVAALCAALAGVVLAALHRPQETRPEPRLADARAQFARAVELRSAARSATPATRVERVRRAAEAYRAVHAYFPGERALVAEAAFRAGELLRSVDASAPAERELELARELGRGTAFRARAGLELGHLLRSDEEHERALAAFLAVAADDSCERRYRDEAELWCGRVQAELGRIGEARRTWERVAAAARSPLTRCRAFDCLTLALVDAADLEGAAGMLARCREALAEHAREETELGVRVRAALSNMRAIRRLERAVAERVDGIIVDKQR